MVTRCNWLICALVMIGLVACERAGQPSVKIEKIFDVSVTQSSRTGYAGEGKVIWTENDVVQYYSRDNGMVESSVLEGFGETAKLHAIVDDGDKYLVGIYGGVSISSPTEESFLLEGAATSEQTGKFGDAHICVGKTTDLDGGQVAFSNLTSLLKFEIQRSDIAQVVVSSCGGEKLHGSGALIVHLPTDETPYAEYSEEGGSSISVFIVSPGEYYVATLPCTLSKGFALKFYNADSDCVGVVEKKGEFEIKPNTIHNLGTLDPRIDDVVSFADEVFKAYCVENFDANQDGEISLTEALEVIELSPVNLGITNFSGVEAFANLSSLSIVGNSANEIDISSLSKLSSLSVENKVKLIVSVGQPRSIYKIGQYVSCCGVDGYVFKTTSPRMISSDEAVKSIAEASLWCASLGSGWALPSVDDLTVVYNNISTLTATITAIGGKQFYPLCYISSDVTPYNAKGVNLGNGHVEFINSMGYVRGVRNL